MRKSKSAYHDPYKALAAAILLRAVKDRRWTKYRQEVNEFFQSPWFEDLCDLAGIAPDVARQAMHVRRA
jgi:hypothetical protein